ncbi:uncharacterized protein LOC124938656 [Impatiens glandulifera]|uniref:uncharacterized protein LOC124938656 n=1 Tax=Impatiens glandulifera TaxID=253017 RepID=UPI001FB0B843|nr:uncharacterized protein LOC124938656 [Impatiens glandulifera]
MSSSSSSFPDVYAWFLNLPSIVQWKSNSMSMIICGGSTTSYQPSLNLKVTKNGQSSICFSIEADFNLPISLWTSKHIKFANILVSPSIMSSLLNNIIKDELKYSPDENASSITLVVPKIELVNNFKDTINFSVLTLAFLVNIYDAPVDVRSECLNILHEQLVCSRSREMMKVFIRLLGSNLEEQWMRTMNLAITNYWVSENQTVLSRTMSSSLFSYALSTSGLWKVQVYCPVVAMDIVKSAHPPLSDERLRFSLNYHQLEGVIQLNYKVVVREMWVDVIVNIDNIRCDITRLINESLMRARGAGTGEKYFPSRISLQLTPSLQTSILSISVSKSSDNPTTEIGVEKSIEGSFEPNSFPGLSVSVGETMTMSLKPWKFEQSVHGNSANLNWFLYDSANGREVFSSKPSKTSMFQPKAWFKNRYSKVYRPFTRQGGVIFAQDEYGEKVCWKMQKNVMGKSMDWELIGFIWLTYWPNKYKTLYTETKRMGFRETLNLTLSQS